VFEEFLAHLRRQGLTIGVDHYLRLQELLSKIGSQCAPGDLKTILCPIFATDANQQKLFHSSFDSYFGIFSQLAASDTSVPSRRLQEEQKLTAEQAQKTRKRKWPYFLLGGALAAGLLILAIVATRKPTAPTPTTTPMSTPTPEAASTPTPVSPAPQAPVQQSPTAQPEGWVQRNSQALRLVAVVLIPLLVFLSYEWYRLIRRRLVLQRQKGKRPPFSWPIRPEASPSEIYGSTEFYGAARRLQRRHAGESYLLDVEGSIQATVDSLGFPRLQYKPGRKLPEYLVLVDRASFRDHQANLFHDLVRALRDEGLYVSLFFFEGDPRVCWDEARGDTVPLFELQRRYAGHRLLLLSNAEKLIDPLTGSLVAWSSLLFDWKDRGILTPEPLEQWGLREKTLASQFVVLPATTEGLFALGDYFELPLQADTLSAQRTSADHAPPEPGDPRRIEALRTYLGVGTFRWLAACAVYPELHWDLTLYLGSLPCLGRGLVTERNLIKLVRLPWFRRGFMPDELRWALIQELGQEREKAVRQAVVDLLEKNPAPKGTYASDAQQLEILFQRYWLDRQNAKKRGDLMRAIRGSPHEEVAQNYTLLRSVESLSKSRLDIVLPARLRRMLFPSGLPALGLKSSVRFAAALALIAVGLLVFLPRNANVGQLMVEANVSGARITVDGRSEPGWVTPYTIPNLSVGPHKVVLSKEGYDDYPGSVSIEGGKINNFNASLVARPPERREAKVGQLQVTANVSGATLSIDGETQSNWSTSTPIDISAGYHQVEVSKDGYDPFQRSVTIEGGKTSRVDARLSEPTGEVDVPKTPPGVDVFIDGKLVGPGPQNVKIGEHKFYARGPWGTRQVKTFKVESGGAVFLRVPEAGGGEAMAMVTAMTIPAGATVTADSSPIGGQTPTSFRLAPGRHTLTISRPGCGPVDQTIEVKAGESKELGVRLTCQTATRERVVETTPPGTVAVAPPNPAPAEARSVPPKVGQLMADANVSGPKALGQRVFLTEGMFVLVRLKADLASDQVAEGMRVDFEVALPVVIQGMTVIPVGAAAWGAVQSVKKGKFVKFDIEGVQLPDGTNVKLRSGQKGSKNSLVKADSKLKGGVGAPKGAEYAACVDEGTEVAVSAAPGIPTPAAPRVANVERVTVMCFSDPSGADILIDGDFYGNTPSILKVPVGKHELEVGLSGYKTFATPLILRPGEAVRTVRAKLEQKE
jgi:hypothetical protein